MSKVTDQNFDDYIEELHADEFLEMVPYCREYILRHCCTESKIDAYKEAFHDKECYKCDECRGYFTHSDDLNENDLCSECAHQETTADKVRTEVNESEGEVNG